MLCLRCPLRCLCVSPEEARVAQAALAKAAAEAERLERRLKRMDKAFVCSICCTNDVDTVLATCGHMMCSSWYENDLCSTVCNTLLCGDCGDTSPPETQRNPSVSAEAFDVRD